MTETQTSTTSATDVPAAAEQDLAGITSNPPPEDLSGGIVSSGDEPWVTQGVQDGGVTYDDDAEDLEPAQAPPPVRVPNVSAGARSGLAHEVIGANAGAAHDANVALAEGRDPDAPADEPLEAPAGSLDDRLLWVAVGEDVDERSRRADEVYRHETTADPDVDAAYLSGRLQAAVYQPESIAEPEVTAQPSDQEPDSTITDGVIQHDVTQGGGGGVEGQEPDASRTE